MPRINFPVETIADLHLLTSTRSLRWLVRCINLIGPAGLVASLLGPTLPAAVSLSCLPLIRPLLSLGRQWHSIQAARNAQSAPHTYVLTWRDML